MQQQNNVLTICISLTLTHTHQFIHCSVRDIQSHNYIKLVCMHTRTEGRWLRWMLSVAVRPQRRCCGAAAPAPVLKSGGRRAGATVWGVFEQRHRKVSSGFFRGVWPAASVESIMANKAQQPPHLHLAEVTASQFLDIWKHFDSDGRTLFSHLLKSWSKLKMHSIFLDRISLL